MEIMSADVVPSSSTAPRQAAHDITAAATTTTPPAAEAAEATPLPAVPSSAPSPSPSTAAPAGPSLHAPPALPPPDRMRVLLELQPAGTPGAPSTPPHPVFKSDGSRFGSTDTTVKLSHQGAYTLSVVCSPPSIIDNAELLGSGSTATLQLESSVQEAAGVSTHSTPWACSLPVSRKNTRHELRLLLAVQGFGELTVPLQVKAQAAARWHVLPDPYVTPVPLVSRSRYATELQVYAGYDKALLHGSRLRHLQYLFKSTSDGTVLTSMAPFASSQ